MTRSSLLLAAAFAALSLPALAAEPKVPVDRDLTGVWTNASLTPLARPRNVGKLELTAEEAAQQIAGNAIGGANDKVWTKEKFSDPNAAAPTKGGEDFGTKAYDTAWTAPGEHLTKIGGKYRSSNIVEPADGQIPYKDVAAAQQRRAIGAAKYAKGDDPYIGPESTTLSERCLIGFGGTGGPGMLSVLYNNTYAFQQTKDHLAIEVEMAHDVRIIPIFDSAQKAKAGHKPASLKLWLGDSVAWWEGKTLVVETINVNPQQAVAGPFYLSPQAKITERLTRTADGIAYNFTVDDPTTYTQPWKAELAFRPQSRIFEYACHEGNYGLEGILAGARAKEAAAAQQASAK